ncbi:MAG: N-acetylmuramoyl-L-alanine amidase [Gammaproteobacteria bacterium]|nr:N-acetylmuramoyl-L-alanine amidase [Gammaproteobacteria bacterium]
MDNRRNFLKKFVGISGIVVAPAISRVANAAQPASVNNIRLSQSASNTRLVFDLDRSIEHSLFRLHNPERVVVDIKDTRLVDSGLIEEMHNALLKGVRTGVRNGADLRIVLDLSNHVTPRSFLLKPESGAGHRLVIDLEDVKNGAIAKKKAKKPKLRDVVVAIDAGHGGKDPGASGHLGTKEKDITLAIARKLHAVIKKYPGMKPVLIRDGDYYMALRERVKKAREHKADLLISLHADSYRDTRARGSSVYALSVDGASSETARWLAEKENASDLIGGVQLDNKDDMVAEVLLDLSLTGTIQSSLDVGDEVLGELKRIGRVHKKRVQQAGFAVLKSPDVPSILLETAFISNPKEERKLRSPAHQAKTAQAILRGVSDYFGRKAPPGTWLSLNNKEHKTSTGETLAGIAEQYEVSSMDLKMLNRLTSDHLQVGQALKIPYTVA